METERNPLPLVTPESVGIDSEAVLRYIRKLEKISVMHGFLLLRHGKTVAEGYYAPWEKGWRHRIYSASKSFVAVAVGMLQDEGKLSINDRIAEYFPEKLPEKLHPYIEAATIRDLLMMATPFYSSTYKVISNPEHDWIKTFFACEPSHRPGQVFSYDTSAATVLSALVEKLSGMSLLDYLRSRGFEEMGFGHDAVCVATPDGRVSWGGSGIICTLRDFAKFALLCQNYGSYQGKQLVSESFMREATSKQIENGGAGYGYQFWMTEFGFSCRGKGGQMAFCVPELDLSFVTIADTQEDESQIGWMEQMFYDMVLPGVREKLPENPESYKALQRYCSDLKIKPVQGSAVSPLDRKISGLVYRMEQNGAKAEKSLRFKTIGLELNGSEGSLVWEHENGDGMLRFGMGYFVHQNFPGFAQKSETEGKPVIVYGIDGMKPPLYMPSMTSAAWKSDHELELVCYSLGYFLGVLRIHLSFDEDTVTIYMKPYAENFWEEYAGLQTGTAEGIKKQDR